MKVLVIEDDELIRGTLRDLLEIHGHEVTTASDGQAGVAAVVAGRPDLVLCDVGLPRLDGYAVLEQVRSLAEGGDVPFIFLTAHTAREDLRRGMQSGADDYLTKPFSEDEVIAAIEARTRRQQPLKQKLARLLAERAQTARAEWSHELLTPLAGVEGGLALIDAEADHLSPAELRELLAMVRTSAERQRRLVSKLVAYFRLVQTEAAAGREPVEVAAHVMAAAELAARAAGRAADLQLECESAEAAVDLGDLAIAVQELVENSCRFSPPGSRIVVRGQRQASDYVIAVIDEGPGLSSGECARVGPFVQFDRARREQQGLGLGVAIARLAAARSGGAVDLSPRSDRVGLVATVRLPRG